MTYYRIYNSSGAGINRSQDHILLSSLITSYRIYNKSITRDTTCGAGTAYHLEPLSSLLVFLVDFVAQSLIFCQEVCFLNQCLPFCPFSFDNYFVYLFFLISGLWLLLLHLLFSWWEKKNYWCSCCQFCGYYMGKYHSNFFIFCFWEIFEEYYFEKYLR